MSTRVQSFLRDGGTLADLASRFAIKAKRHGEHPNLVLLKYNQIDSPMSEPIVRECRGIVLDEADDWRCVSRAFDKFFNYGEGYAAAIDWATARVQEKLDGSLCALYWYAGRWHVATTGTPDACGDVHGSGLRFSDLFRETCAAQCVDLPHPTAQGLTFIFELTAPENRVVVPHSERRVTLLACRHPDGWEITPREAVDAYWFTDPDAAPPIVSEHPLGSIEEALATFDTLSPLHNEGYVVVDAAFHRIKVKHPGYVAIHHAKDGLTPRALLEIARRGEASEVVAAFPELQAELDAVSAKVHGLCDEVAADFERLRNIESQKEFAIAAQRCRHAGALFALRAGKAESAANYFATVTIDGLMRAIGMKPERRPEAA